MALDIREPRILRARICRGRRRMPLQIRVRKIRGSFCFCGTSCQMGSLFYSHSLTDEVAIYDEYVVNGEIGQHKEGLTDEVAICDEYVVDGAIGKRNGVVSAQ